MRMPWLFIGLSLMLAGGYIFLQHSHAGPGIFFAGVILTAVGLLGNKRT